ncbi:hypothetical protein EAF56_06620 [Vibrio alginolyticus]|uniref:O-antigen ligase family protein n=2 Tax=Vibrio TaxID=662 RepID=UPI001D9CACB0|nr:MULTISPECIES: O-antigen ligase family protein [Vibrio]EGR1295677.1 hypothetical protein [Vibrio alginolyticus]MCS0172967.1 O-antigen ligase family protein [Vibrio alginolyticus]MDW2158275.1 O-antigen ligase family protein [Vibrio sp. 1942]
MSENLRKSIERLFFFIGTITLLHVTLLYRLFEPLYNVRIPFFIFLPLFFLGMGMLLSLQDIFKRKREYSNYILIISFIFFVLIFIFNVSFSSKYIEVGTELTSTNFYVVILIKSISSFLCGWVLYGVLERKRKSLNFIYFLVIISILSFIDFTNLTFDFSVYEDINDRNSYLIVSDMLVICHFLSIFRVSNILVRSILHFIVLLLLFLLGSRTSLYLFFSSILFCELVLSSTKRVVIPLYLIAVITGFLYLTHTGFWQEYERMFSIFTGSADHSISARKELAKAGLNSIQNNMILGDFMGQVSHGGGGTMLGSYIHDYRSYIRQFGLIGFIPILVLFSWISVVAVRVVNFKKTNFHHYTYLSLYTYLVVEMIFSRAFNYTFWYFLVGYAANINKKASHE